MLQQRKSTNAQLSMCMAAHECARLQCTSTNCMCRVQVRSWRSEVMNFTLALIYPGRDADGARNVPLTELCCVLTADQTCSSSLFASLLRYIDSGDDVAAALCPRIHYNVDGDCDIFDHQRVAYYEKAQLGMDAYGFTACMHTNFVVRARALQEVGWFPERTSAENWELGMLLVRTPRPQSCCALLRSIFSCISVYTEH